MKTIRVSDTLRKALILLLAILLSVGGFPAVPAMAAGTTIPIAVELNSFTGLVNSSTTGTSLFLTTDNAGLDGNNLMTNPEVTYQKGTVVRRSRMLMSDTGFSTYFKFHIYNDDSVYSGIPADGLCFIVYGAGDDTTDTGSYGEGLGYYGVDGYGNGGSVAVEFDTYYNYSKLDPTTESPALALSPVSSGIKHIAIDKDGDLSHSGSRWTAYTAGVGNGTSINPVDAGTANNAYRCDNLVGTDMNVWADYDGSTGYMTVTYGTSTTRASSSNLSFKRNVGTTLVGNYVYVGFSGSTGAATEKNDILKWYFSNNYVEGGLSSGANAYTQGAVTVGMVLDGTGTNNATEPSHSTITAYDKDGAVMKNTDIKIAIDGTDTGATYNTGSGGSYQYTFSGLSGGSHTITATTADGSAAKTMTFTAPNPPTITTSPANVTKTVGQTAAFSAGATVTVAGDTLSYQWQKAPSGSSTYSDISGATSSSYTTSTLTMTDNGNKYRCVITEVETGAAATTSAAMLTVQQQANTLTLTASPSSPQTYPGNVPLTATLGSYYGSVSGKTISFYNSATLLGTASTNGSGVATYTLTSPSPSTTYSFTASFTGDIDNTGATSTAVSYTVNKAAQSVLTITDPGRKTYGDDAFSLSVSGGSGSGALSYSSGNTSVATVNSSGQVTIAGAGSSVITVTKAADSNYNSTSNTVTVYVDPKTLNATITPNSKVYDAATAATISSVAYNSFAYSDTSSVVYITGGTLSFANVSAGDNKAVTASGYSLAGSKAGNYTLGSVTANTANITKKTLTVINTAVSDKIYDGSNAASFSGMPELSGVVSGDDVSLTGGTAGFASKDYSASAIVVTFSGFGITGTKAANYSLTQPSAVSAHINKRTLNISTNPVSILCGEPIPALIVSATGFASGDSAVTLGGFALPSASISYSNTTVPVANAPVTVTYTGGNATANYVFNYNTSTTVTIQAVTVNDGDYTVSPAPNAAGWNNSDITISPANGYDRISADGTLWIFALIVSTESGNGAATFYLKNSVSGLQTASKSISYKLDKTNPSDMTITAEANSFTDLLHTITFGLFFGDTVDVSLAAFDSLSGIDHYEYQIVDTSLGQTYDASGTWISTASGTFGINPQFKGAIYARAVDIAGNVSAVVQSDGLVADDETPTAPTVKGAIGGDVYDHSWTANDVTLTASDSKALSGIAYYEYKVGESGTWTKMPVKSGATDAVSLLEVADRLTIDSNMNAAVHVRAVSNSGITGDESIFTVKRDAVIPQIKVLTSGVIGQWTKDSVTFTFSNTESNLSPITYWVKIGTANWTPITGSVYTLTTETNTVYQFKAVSEAGLESEASDAYSVKVVGPEMLKKLLDTLPDPKSATDDEIRVNEDEIKEAKIIYDLLSDIDKSGLGQAATDKLSGLLNRLASLLVIQPKDEYTGIQAGNIGTAIQVPELNDPDVSKVVLALVVDQVATTGTSAANIIVAIDNLDDDGKKMIAAYDMAIFKTVLDTKGKTVSYGKVDNTSIMAPVSVLIPIPSQYANRTDLEVTYIDGNGTVTRLDSKIVTIDNVTYLQFSTTHFSVYAVTISKKGGSDSEPDTGDHSNPIVWMGVACAMAIIVVGILCFLVKRKRKINVI